MTSSALPDNWRDLLAGYVLGDLDADETAQVQQWLGQYPEVAAELASLQDTWHSLPQGLPAQGPPAGLRQRILATVQQPTNTGPAARPRRPWAMVGFAGWAVTAAVLVVVAVDNYQLRRETLRQQAIVASFSQPRNQLYRLVGTDAAPAASGRLLIDVDEQVAFMATQQLPPLPAEQAYRLWTLAGETPIYCGQFNPAADGEISQWSLPDPACQTPPGPLLVTQESATAPPMPQGPLVLQDAS